MAQSPPAIPAPRAASAAAPWLAIAALAFTLRFFHLGRESLWTDEYLTLMTASQESLGSFWENLRARDPHPPLYFLMMFGWVRAGLTGDAALRVPSAVFGGIQPVLFYTMLRGLFPERRVAFLGGMLMALSPMAIWYSQEARPYAILLALETGALAALAADWKRNPARCGKLSITAAALAVLALWTHFFGGLACAVVMIGLVARDAAKDRIWLASLAVLFAGAAWPVFAALQSLHSGVGIDWLPKSYDRTLWIDVMRAQWLGAWFSPLPLGIQQAGIVAGAALMLAGILAVARRIREERAGAAILLAGFAVLFILPVAVSFIKPIIFYGQRYMIVALPATLALGAAGTMRGPRGWRIAAAGLLAAVIACNGAYLRTYYSHRHKHVWDETAMWIAAQGAPGEPIFVYPPYVAGLLERYLPPGRRVHPVADWSAAPAQFVSAGSGFWLVAYGDTRPWLAGHGFPSSDRPAAFGTTYPPTRIFAVRVPAAP